jgi:hypothetical protein
VNIWDKMGAIGQADYLRAVHGQGETEEIEKNWWHALSHHSMPKFA